MSKRILLVKPNGKKGLGFLKDVIPIGLEYIAASIEEEVEKVWIIDMEFEGQPLQRFLEDFNPDLVGITMSATDHYEGLRLARLAKEKGVKTVLGGYHPTAIPDELLSYPQIDIVIRGEGELTMKELVQIDSPEDVLGVSYKIGEQVIHNPDRPLIKDLDALSFPARHLRRHRYRDHANNNGREFDVITMSRGCWGACTFCCEPYMSKKCMRFRSPENIMEELAEIVSFHKGKPLHLFATDPHFIGDPENIDRLCDLLHTNRLDITFSVMTRPDSIVRNPELVRKMCDNGILNYELGIESSNQKDLNNVKKGITIDIQRKAVEILRENGANVSGTLVIGLPDQSEEEIKQFPVYAKEIGLINCAFGIATPFPGTEFYEGLEAKEMIFEQDWTKYDEMHSVFKLNSMSAEDLERLESYCMGRFWTLNTFLDRASVLRKISGGKLSLLDFIGDIIGKLSFVKDAGYDLRESKIKDHIEVILDAIVDAEKEDKERNIQACDVIEASRFLKILGPQTIQVTLSNGAKSASYVIKTTGKKAEYIRTIPGRQVESTIDINVDLDQAIDSLGKDSLLGLVGSVSPLGKARSVEGAFNMLRLCTALTTDLGYSYLNEKLRRSID
jgi:magnesium-protoporphyrin IX monomethyl ester (oxidative) cyclase